MKYPEFLKENGTIGLVAPSCGAAFEPYISCLNNAIKNFKDMGYYVNLGPNCYEGKGIGISNTPELCARELMEEYANPDNDIIVSCGGGECMCETMSNVDFEVLKKADPKWYMGYSDNTNMTFLMTTILDTASIYGPCAGSFGMEPWHKYIQDAWDVVTGKKLTVSNYDMFEVESLKSPENPLATVNATMPVEVLAFEPQIINEDVMSTDTSAALTVPHFTRNLNFSGRLLGGCMDCLSNLVGTRLDYVNQFIEKYKEDGIIWYLEACDLNVFGIRRALWQMYEAGWFKYVKGFIFGRPANPFEMYGLNHVDAALDMTVKKLQVPVIIDADIGHVSPMMTIINGAMADVNFADGNLSIEMKLL